MPEFVRVWLVVALTLVVLESVDVVVALTLTVGRNVEVAVRKQPL